MKLEEMKQSLIRQDLSIDESYGRILSIIDFGNVNHWFGSDRQDSDNKVLGDNEVFIIDLQGLKNFTSVLSSEARFYYGLDRANPGSVNFTVVAKGHFGKHRVFTKQIQYVRHHLSETELRSNTRAVFKDGDGQFIRLPKANFDVEIAVDAIRLMDQYDTLTLFSGDADFVALARYLKSKGKKVILVKAGNITTDLRNACDLVVNAQKIKKYITKIEQRKKAA